MSVTERLSPLESSLGRLRRLVHGRDGDDPEALKEFAASIARLVEQIPDYDVVGMEALADRLRLELRNIDRREDGLNSINKLSKRVRVSRTYLARFRDGDAVCMNIMNRLAATFGIRYLIENYEDPKPPGID